MPVATETELHRTAARQRLHGTVAAAMREIADHAADALGSVRALVALLPAEAGRTLADDVHDTLGHALSLASLLAGGAAARLANDPALARQALGQLATLAADTIAELERLLGAPAARPTPAPDDPRRSPPTSLGGSHRSPPPTAGDAHRPRPPAPADMAMLTSLARDQPVTFDVDGAALSAAPPEVAGAVYRIVRESLTNARKHTDGAPVHVRVAGEESALTVAVVNAPSQGSPAPGTGRGIPGMRRRARAVGGRLAAGPTREGGFRVEARLPR